MEGIAEFGNGIEYESMSMENDPFEEFIRNKQEELTEDDLSLWQSIIRE